MRSVTSDEIAQYLQNNPQFFEEHAELMSQLKQRHPHLRGIAISGFGMDEDITASHTAGFSKHLTKPVGAELLQAAVEEIALTLTHAPTTPQPTA